MNIRLLVVGKLKEKFFKDARNEYLKRLSKYSKIEIQEINDEICPSNASKKDEEIIKNKEGLKLLEKIKKQDYVIILDLMQKEYSSEEFALFLNNCFTNGKTNLTFVIGGSLGLSEEVKKRANVAISFSKMTFPHQLMRVILLEQLYRAFKINNHEIYHK